MRKSVEIIFITACNLAAGAAVDPEYSPIYLLNKYKYNDKTKSKSS